MAVHVEGGNAMRHSPRPYAQAVVVACLRKNAIYRPTTAVKISYHGSEVYRPMQAKKEVIKTSLGTVTEDEIFFQKAVRKRKEVKMLNLRDGKQ